MEPYSPYPHPPRDYLTPRDSHNMPQNAPPNSPAPASPDHDRKVASKDNAGGKHRVIDKTRAASKRRASLSASTAALDTATDGTTPLAAPPPDPTPATNAETPRTEEPRVGEKRVRSDSASSLSTQPIPGPAAPSTAPVPLAPAARPTPSTPIRTGAAAATAKPMTPSPTYPTSYGDLAPSPPYQVQMIAKYRDRLTSEDPPAPHDLEPIFHTFHTDTPAMSPNPNHPHRPSDATLERLLALRNQRTRKCDPQNSLTRLVPTPRYGWPRVFHPSPDFLYANLPDTTLDKWLADDNKGKKVIVQVMKQNSWASPQCDTTANLIVRTLEAYYDVEKIKVATASEDIRGRSQQNAPYSFLVFGLPTSVAERILAQHCFATAHIQFLAYPLIYAATPCFLGSILGLRNLGDDPDDIIRLSEDLVSILIRNPGMNRAIRTYAAEVAASAGDTIMDQDAAVTRVMHKFYIGLLSTKTHGGIKEPTITMYIELPASTELDRAFPTFVDAATRIAFETPLTGSGRFSRGFQCFSCRSTTHPTGLCPFETIQDWAEITKPDKDEANTPPPPSHPGAPPPPPSPRHPGPPPPRRDNQAGPSRLPAPSFRSSRGPPPGRG